MPALPNLPEAPIAVAAIIGVGLVFVTARVMSGRSRRGKHDDPLTLWDKLVTVRGLLKFRLRWGEHTTSESAATSAKRQEGIAPAVVELIASNPKFMSPVEVAALIPDDAVVNTAGFPISERCTAFWFAIRSRFQKEQHPKNLTWISVGAQGSRGKAPGSIDELAIPGLITTYITGHCETAKAMLKLADQQHVKLFNLPQGTLGKLVSAQARGEYELVSTVGVGSYFDSRVSHTGYMNRPKGSTETSPYVSVSEDGNSLVYRIPKIQIAMLNARYCDTDGNVYLDLNSTLTESPENVTAAVRHGGKVFVSVQRVLSVAEAKKRNVAPELIIPANQVDGIVVFNVGIAQDHMKMRAQLEVQSVSRTPAESLDLMNRLWYTLRFVNRLLKITPKRTECDVALGRIGAMYFVKTFAGMKPDEKKLGAIGVGLPEEVSHNMFVNDICPKHITLTTETGTYGGLPAMGMFFGCAITPDNLYTSGTIFTKWKTELNTVCLGAIEVDGVGNVNVSRKGDGVLKAIGSGGFCDLVDSARHLVFLFTWSQSGQYSIDHASGKLNIKKRGKCKLVKQVSEVTMCAKTALRLGKRVTYLTSVGAFELTENGLKLTAIVPGVDVKRDILEFADCDIIVPPEVITLDSSVVTGKGFTLEMP